MALERLEPFSVLETDDVIRGNRPLQRHSGLEIYTGLPAPARYPRQSAVDLIDEGREVLRRHRVVADISRDDRSRELDECSARRIDARGLRSWWPLVSGLPPGNHAIRHRRLPLMRLLATRARVRR